MSAGPLLDRDGALALVRAILAGDSTVVIALIGSATVLDVPRLPLAFGSDEVASVLDQVTEAYPYGLAKLTHRNSVIGRNGRLHELRARIRVDGREVLLPVAVVDSIVSGRRHIRLYHSGRLITGQRAGRRAVFAVDPDTAPTPVDEVHPAVGAYLAAITSGDPQAVLARFAPGASLDNGVRPVVDVGELRAVFTAMTRSGGVRLVCWNEIDDGRSVAFEYSGLPRPEKHDSAPRTPPGGGIGVYTYASDGRIESVRMYDDFDPDALITIGMTSVDSDHSS